MKKIMLPAVVLLSVFVLTGCASGGNEKSSNSESEGTFMNMSSETTDLSSSVSQEMVFTATVVSVTELETKEPAVQILLEDPVALEGSEDAIGSFQNGVALNVNPETLEMAVEEIEVGSQLKVTLAHPSVMTMSITPQVPGNSILSIELVK